MTVILGQKRLLKVASFLSFLMLFMFGNVTISQAQRSFWSRQEKIPEYNEVTEEPPYMIPDQNHIIHGFNSQPLQLDLQDSPRAIFYRFWTLENGWSIPNDILFDQSGSSLDLVGVTSDKLGLVHLVYEGNSNNLYYTQSTLAAAGQPDSWSVPQLIASSVTTIRPGIANVGAIAASADGNQIVVVFSGAEFGSGLYFVGSVDHGESWSTPYPVYLASGNLLITDPEIYSSESNNFYSVWTTLQSDGFGGPGYFARFDSGTASWTEPMQIDIPGIRTPSVIEYDNAVFISYHHINSNGNWWRRSEDRGQTWSYPSQVSAPHVGTNGGLSFVVDSRDILHAFFGERIDDNNHGMWHVIWTGKTWSTPEAVVRGSQVKDIVGGRGFDPRSARAVISNGNLVLVAWGTDGAAGLNGSWFSYKVLDAPEIANEPLPLPTDLNLFSSTPYISALPDTIAQSTSIPGLINEKASSELLQSPQTYILIGVIPVVLTLLGVILFFAFIRPNRR